VRSTSSKLRPVDMGYTMINLMRLSGPMTKTLRTVWKSDNGRPSDPPTVSAGSMPYSLAP